MRPTATHSLSVCLFSLALASTPPQSASAQVPALLNYQGRVVVNGTNFDGTGQFQLALVDAGSRTFWSNGPAAVSLPVNKGLYSVLLGDTSVSNMAALPASVFTNSDVRLRVWFGGQPLSPDQRIASAGYALNAQTAQGVANGAITASMIATGAVGAAQLAEGAVTSVTIADGSIGAADLGNNSITTAAIAEGAVTADRIRQVLDTVLSATITNPAPAASDYFGYSVAGVGSNRFVVGAYADDAGANNAGSAYLYDLNGTLIAPITNPAPATGDFFGYSVASVGPNCFVVGAHQDDTGAPDAGSVYLYDLNGTLVSPPITNPAPAATDSFGHSVAGVGSNRFVVGAYADDAGAPDAGSVYVYDLNGTLAAPPITNPAPATSDYFGYSVAGVGSNRFVVGAYQDDTGATDAGSVYVYDLNGALVVPPITNPAPVAYDGFGHSVAGVGSTHFVVGACYDDTGAGNAGSVYLYDLNGALVATVSNPAPAVGDRFGYFVAGVDSTHFAVATCYDDAGATDAGTVYLYDLSGTLVATVTNPTPTDTDLFGCSIASVGSDGLVIGAYGNDAGASGAGSVYLYDIPGGTHADGVIADGVRPGAITASMLDTRYIRAGGDAMTGPLVVNSDLTVSGAFSAPTTRYIDINCYGTYLGSGASFAYAIGGAITIPDTNTPNATFTFSIPPDYISGSALYCDLLWKNIGTNGTVSLRHNYESIQRSGSLVTTLIESNPAAVSEGVLPNYAHMTTIALTNAYQVGDAVTYGFYRQTSDSSTNSILIGGIRIRYAASR
jgi:hypothetical protein